MHRNVSQHSKVRTVKCGVCNCANFAPNIQRFHNWTRSTVIAMRITKSSNEGGLAQMVERSLSMREVPGSMPGSSITLFTQLTTFTICVNELHQPQHVRMAERSKAPDSRVTSLPLTTKEHSGPRMWAWVRIPLLTSFFHVKPTKGSFAIQQYVEMEKSPPSRIWTSDLRIPVLLSQLQSSALPTELSVVGVTAFTNLTYSQRVPVNGIKIWYVAEGGFDPPTSGLWAQHASSAPLC